MKCTRRENGAAFVEMAVVFPLLLLLCLGAADFGRVMYWTVTLSHAARAGAQYGAQSNGKAADAAGIRQAALQEAQDIGVITVASQVICECTSGGAVACTATCAGYGAPQVAVQVTTSATFRTIAPYPGVPNTVPLSQTAKLRVQ